MKYSFSYLIKHRFSRKIQAAVYNCLFASDDSDEYAFRGASANFRRFDIESVFPYQTLPFAGKPQIKLDFDIMIEADIYDSVITSADKFGKYIVPPQCYSDNECHRHLVLSCTADISRNLDDFRITSVTPAASCRIRSGLLSDSLVPVLAQPEYERTACTLLRMYCPEAYTGRGPVDVMKAAANAGLDVQYRRITADGSKLGVLYFSDSQAKYYDGEKYTAAAVRAGTVFIDKEAPGHRFRGVINNTVMHELVHWVLGRPAYHLRRIYNDDPDLLCRAFNTWPEIKYSNDPDQLCSGGEVRCDDENDYFDKLIYMPDSDDILIEDMPVEDTPVEDMPVEGTQLHFEGIGTNRYELIPQIDTAGKPADKPVLSDVRLEEMYANNIAPKMLIPAVSAMEQYRRYTSSLRRKFSDPAEVTEQAVRRLAEFYNTSDELARIRVEELGCARTAGVLNYVDGRYVRPYTAKRSRYDITYTIGFRNVISEYSGNPLFRELMDSGKFTYAESHCCLKDKKYIAEGPGGELILTGFARAHLEKCCLAFVFLFTGTVSYESGQSSLKYRNSLPATEVVVAYRNLRENARLLTGSHIDFSGESMKAYIDSKNTVLENMPYDFGNTVKWFLDIKRKTIEEFSEDAEISPRNLKYIIGEKGKRHKIETVVKILLALHLPEEISFEILNRNNYMLGNDGQEGAYRFLLKSLYMLPIHECNEKLISAGFKPLQSDVA